MDAKTFNITQAGPDDLHAIKELMLKALAEDPYAFSATYNEYNTNSDSWWNSYLNPFLTNFFQSMTIAKEDDKVVGMVGVMYDHKIRKKHIAAIVWFYIDKKARGLGLGKKLINTLLEEIVQNPEIKKLSLMVNQPQKKAIKIYIKLGFKKNGTLKNELNFDGKFHDVYIMEKILNKKI